MATVKLDEDLVILFDHLESRGVHVDKLLYSHLWKIDGRLKGNVDIELESEKPPMPPPPLSRLERVSILGAGLCPKCSSTMEWDRLFLPSKRKCIHPKCGFEQLKRDSESR